MPRNFRSGIATNGPQLSEVEIVGQANGPLFAIHGLGRSSRFAFYEVLWPKLLLANSTFYFPNCDTINVTLRDFVM